MTKGQHRRMLAVAAFISLFAVLVTGRLVIFQAFPDQQVTTISRSIQYQLVTSRPARGVVTDRNGTVLAGNGFDYSISVSPPMVIEPEKLAVALAQAFDQPMYDLLDAFRSDAKYVSIAGRVNSKKAEEVRAIDLDGLEITPLPRREYPQGDMLCHALGYTDFDGIGGAGLERYYQSELAGSEARAVVNISPLTQRSALMARDGTDVRLTIDRTVQFTVEEHLRRAVEQYQATGGSIIVMDPRSGSVLAIAATPCYSPYSFFDVDEELLHNPAIASPFEPGSLMRLFTVAAALDEGAISPATTYFDLGIIEVGGIKVSNQAMEARGFTSVDTVMAESLDVGLATFAKWMGTRSFYDYMNRFGFGRATGIDISGEIAGQMPLPGDSDWTDASLGTNAVGRDLTMTPIQIASAVSALANDGILMRPRIAGERRYKNHSETQFPIVMTQVVREHVAREVTSLAVEALKQSAPQAIVPGYATAGASGTARIPDAGIYHPTDTIATFAGWLPADAPELVVLIKLDRPQLARTGAETAAPLFSELASELVVLLDIPPDNVRMRSEVVAVRNS